MKKEWNMKKLGNLYEITSSKTTFILQPRKITKTRYYQQSGTSTLNGDP
jgi:hypothetical protein